MIFCLKKAFFDAFLYKKHRRCEMFVGNGVNHCIFVYRRYDIYLCHSYGILKMCKLFIYGGLHHRLIAYHRSAIFFLNIKKSLFL